MTTTPTAPTPNAKLRQHGLVAYTKATIEPKTGFRTVTSFGAQCAIPATGSELKVSGTYQHPGTKELSEVTVTIASATPAQLVKFAKTHGINLTPTA